MYIVSGLYIATSPISMYSPYTDDVVLGRRKNQVTIQTPYKPIFTPYNSNMIHSLRYQHISTFG